MDLPTVDQDGRLGQRHGGRIPVCFVLSYRAPDYIRGRSICKALEDSGNIQLTYATNRSRGLPRYWQTVRALIEAKRKDAPAVYILGFRGHEIAWLVRWITRGAPLIFDAMMSPYAALREEAKLGSLGRWLAPLWRGYEATALRSADAILVDTATHANYYSNEFSLPLDKFVVVPVGAVEHNDSLDDVPSDRQGLFRVLFYGSFLPLHGVDQVLEAAGRMADLPIEFRFIGGTTAQAKRLRAVCEKKGVRYSHALWVPFQRLISQEIPNSDLCLGGPFGGTPQARRVVTGKTSQCMALGKATIVGRIDEDYGFIDQVNCLLVDQGDSHALETSVRWAFHHRSSLHEIGLRGRSLYFERLSLRLIASRLVPVIRRLAN